MGAGTARCEEDTLVIGDDKANRTVREYGHVPGQVLRMFEEQLRMRYKEFCPAIKSIRLDPDETASGGNWNLAEVVRVLQMQH